MKMKSKGLLGFTAGLALLLAGPAGALTINQGLTSGELNTIEDQDREALIDVNNNGILDIGDVFVGFVRFDDFLPGGGSTNNQIYGVISNQIIAQGTTANEIFLGTTTVVGLRLEDLTGDSTTAGGMFAVYDRNTPYANNLVTSPVGTSMADNVDFIESGGTLRLVAGLQEPEDFFFVNNSLSGLGLGTSTSLFPTLPTSVTVGTFAAGLSFLYNDTNFEFERSVIAATAVTGVTTHQVVVGNGAIRGASGDGNEGVFANAGYAGFQQCTVNGVNTACGFATDADFFVKPMAVPEPTSLALMGLGLLGFGVTSRRWKKAA